MIGALTRLLGRGSTPYATELLPAELRQLLAGASFAPEHLPTLAHLPAEKPAKSGKAKGGKRPARVANVPPSTGKPLSRGSLVVEALVMASGPLTVSELAERMGCCRGESSKRIKLAGNRVRKEKRGRNVYVSLA